MQHAIGYHGPFDNNFTHLRPGVEFYRTRDGVERPLPRWPKRAEGVRFSFMQKGRQFLVVRARRGRIDVVVKEPVVLRRNRHMAGKWVGPSPTYLGDESALHLLEDMTASNPSQRDALHTLQETIAGKP